MHKSFANHAKADYILIVLVITSYTVEIFPHIKWSPSVKFEKATDLILYLEGMAPQSEKQPCSILTFCDLPERTKKKLPQQLTFLTRN